MQNLNLVLHEESCIKAETSDTSTWCIGPQESQTLIYISERSVHIVLLTQDQNLTDTSRILGKYLLPDTIKTPVHLHWVDEDSAFFLIDEYGQFFRTTTLKEWSFLGRVPLVESTSTSIENRVVAACWSNGEGVCAVITRFGRLFFVSTTAQIEKSLPLAIPQVKTDPPVIFLSVQISWASDNSSLSISSKRSVPKQDSSLDSLTTNSTDLTILDRSFKITAHCQYPHLSSVCDWRPQRPVLCVPELLHPVKATCADHKCDCSSQDDDICSSSYQTPHQVVTSLLSSFSWEGRPPPPDQSTFAPSRTRITTKQCTETSSLANILCLTDNGSVMDGFTIPSLQNAQKSKNSSTMFEVVAMKWNPIGSCLATLSSVRDDTTLPFILQLFYPSNGCWMLKYQTNIARPEAATGKNNNLCPSLFWDEGDLNRLQILLFTPTSIIHHSLLFSLTFSASPLFASRSSPFSYNAVVDGDYVHSSPFLDGSIPPSQLFTWTTSFTPSLSSVVSIAYDHLSQLILRTPTLQSSFPSLKELKIIKQRYPLSSQHPPNTSTFPFAVRTARGIQLSANPAVLYTLPGVAEGPVLSHFVWLCGNVFVFVDSAQPTTLVFVRLPQNVSSLSDFSKTTIVEATTIRTITLLSPVLALSQSVIVPSSSHTSDHSHASVISYPFMNQTNSGDTKDDVLPSSSIHASFVVQTLNRQYTSVTFTISLESVPFYSPFTIHPSTIKHTLLPITTSPASQIDLLLLKVPQPIHSQGTEKPSFVKVVASLGFDGVVYVNGEKVTEGITSMEPLQTETICALLCTSHSTLSFVPLTVSSTNGTHSINTPVALEYTRQIERGALIVPSSHPIGPAQSPSAAPLLLQIPRGNLELVHPRPLILHSFLSALRSNSPTSFLTSLQIAHKHRLQPALICHFDLATVLNGVEEIVNQIGTWEIGERLRIGQKQKQERDNVKEKNQAIEGIQTENVDEVKEATIAQYAPVFTSSALASTLLSGLFSSISETDPTRDDEVEEAKAGEGETDAEPEQGKKKPSLDLFSTISFGVLPEDKELIDGRETEFRKWLSLQRQDRARKTTQLDLIDSTRTGKQNSTLLERSGMDECWEEAIDMNMDLFSVPTAHFSLSDVFQRKDLPQPSTTPIQQSLFTSFPLPAFLDSTSFKQCQSNFLLLFFANRILSLIKSSFTTPTSGTSAHLQCSLTPSQFEFTLLSLTECLMKVTPTPFIHVLNLFNSLPPNLVAFFASSNLDLPTPSLVSIPARKLCLRHIVFLAGNAELVFDLSFGLYAPALSVELARETKLDPKEYLSDIQEVFGLGVKEEKTPLLKHGFDITKEEDEVATRLRIDLKMRKFGRCVFDLFVMMLLDDAKSEDTDRTWETPSFSRLLAKSAEWNELHHLLQLFSLPLETLLTNQSPLPLLAQTQSFHQKRLEAIRIQLCLSVGSEAPIRPLPSALLLLQKAHHISPPEGYETDALSVSLLTPLIPPSASQHIPFRQIQPVPPTSLQLGPLSPISIIVPSRPFFFVSSAPTLVSASILLQDKRTKAAAQMALRELENWREAIILTIQDWQIGHTAGSDEERERHFSKDEVLSVMKDLLDRMDGAGMIEETNNLLIRTHLHKLNEEDEQTTEVTEELIPSLVQTHSNLINNALSAHTWIQALFEISCAQVFLFIISPQQTLLLRESFSSDFVDTLKDSAEDYLTSLEERTKRAIAMAKKTETLLSFVRGEIQPTSLAHRQKEQKKSGWGKDKPEWKKDQPKTSTGLRGHNVQPKHIRSPLEQRQLTTIVTDLCQCVPTLKEIEGKGRNLLSALVLVGEKKLAEKIEQSVQYLVFVLHSAFIWLKQSMYVRPKHYYIITGWNGTRTLEEGVFLPFIEVDENALRTVEELRRNNWGVLII